MATDLMREFEERVLAVLPDDKFMDVHQVAQALGYGVASGSSWQTALSGLVERGEAQSIDDWRAPLGRRWRRTPEHDERPVEYGLARLLRSGRWVKLRYAYVTRTHDQPDPRHAIEEGKERTLCGRVPLHIDEPRRDDHPARIECNTCERIVRRML